MDSNFVRANDTSRLMNSNMSRPTGIEASFTHADLAHIIGVTQQWIATTFQRYEERGIVDAKGRRLLIRNASLLEQIRDGVVDPLNE
jgi:hypothetical protein